jgi:aryl-alcohol dehydrogenase-like predicted oxidoreductase
VEYRRLGKSNLNVSVIALGCWPFAGGAYWGDQPEKDSIDTVHAALAAGINFFDTAEGYENGQSERVLGKALIGRRSEAIIATKVSGKNLRPADVAVACERSLRNLQMDHVDLYQIHWPNHEVPLADTVGALSRLKEAGKVGAIGVSNFAVRDLTDMLALGECVSDQLPFSLLWRVIEREIQPLCVRKEVGIICYSPLAQGLLTGRYRSAEEVPDGLAQSRWYSGTRPQAQHGEAGAEAEVFAALRDLAGIAAELGIPMATMALAWAKAQPGVTSFLVGARNPEELKWNLPVVDVALGADILGRLAAATEPVKAKLGSNPDMWLVPGRMR